MPFHKADKIQRYRMTDDFIAERLTIKSIVDNKYKSLAISRLNLFIIKDWFINISIVQYLIEYRICHMWGPDLNKNKNFFQN